MTGKRRRPWSHHRPIADVGRGARRSGHAGAGRESGVVGGVEILPFGLLVFVSGALIAVNGWAVVDARLAVAASAREAGRAYVESTDPARAEEAAWSAARDAIRGGGRDPDRLGLRADATGLSRCLVVTHEASYRVPTISVPFVGSWGHGILVRARHRDVVDPFASGLPGDGDCAR